jgi:hypothetical protein
MVVSSQQDEKVVCIKCGSPMQLPFYMKGMAKCDACSNFKVAPIPPDSFTPVPDMSHLTAHRIITG